jgi:glycosyltransferase involved in cell wall biosynthesis
MGVNDSRRMPRVACPPSVRAYPHNSGVDTLWRHVLTELGRDMKIRFLEPSSPRRWITRPEVWLHDGHAGPLEADAPVVAQLHEAAWDDPDTRALLDPAFIAAYEEPSRLAAQNATRVVTPSESSRRQIAASYGVPAERIVVAPHGVDHSVFHPRATGGHELVARAGGDPDRPYVLFVSQLHPRKNLAVLRAAMARLIARGYPHGLVVVGGPPADRADGDALVQEAEAPLPGTEQAVVRLQRLTDAQLAAVTAGASVFCLPSLMEGFGLTALEAMACGVPVVVSDRGALPEVVADAGIVTAPTADAVEAALAGLLADDDRARALGNAGRERSQGFTWTATARAWRRSLEEAAAETPTSNRTTRDAVRRR